MRNLTFAATAALALLGAPGAHADYIDDYLEICADARFSYQQITLNCTLALKSGRLKRMCAPGRC